MTISQSLHGVGQEKPLSLQSDQTLPPSWQGKFFQYISIVSLSFALVWMVIVHLNIPILPYDDAFVTFRYVQNFLEGKGLVYNQGQKVFGSTTPLYLIWITLLKFFFSGWAIPHLAVRFNALPFGSAGLALFFLLRNYTGSIPVALLGSVAFLLNPILMSISGGGMESFLFLTLLLLTLLSLADKKPIRVGIFCGLSVLARPEGLLILPLLMLRFFKHPKDLMKILLLFSLIILPWVIFSWLYYGSPIPLSLIAKTRPLYPLPQGHALGLINTWMTASMTCIFSKALQLPISITAWGVLILTSLGTFFFGAGGRSVWQGTTLFWIFILSYGFGNPLFFQWYWPNVFILALVVLMTGFYYWGLLWGKYSKWVGRSIWMAGMGWLLYASLMPNLIPVADKKAGLSATTWIIISDPSRWQIQAYQEAAKTLNQAALPTDTVAAPEVGALGFYYRGFIYDACGLVSPEALPFLPVPPDQRSGSNVGAISTDFIKKVNPDWVVTMPFFSRKSLQRSDWFAIRYPFYKKIPLPFPLWGDSFVYIYKKRGDL